MRKELLKALFAFIFAAVVMKDGDIIESGTHEGLPGQNGFYAELYNSRLEQSAWLRSWRF